MFQEITDCSFKDVFLGLIATDRIGSSKGAFEWPFVLYYLKFAH